MVKKILKIGYTLFWECAKLIKAIKNQGCHAQKANSQLVHNIFKLIYWDGTKKSP